MRTQHLDADMRNV